MELYSLQFNTICIYKIERALQSFNSDSQSTNSDCINFSFHSTRILEMHSAPYFPTQMFWPIASISFSSILASFKNLLPFCAILSLISVEKEQSFFGSYIYSFKKKSGWLLRGIFFSN